MDRQTCFMAAKKANNRSFTKYLGKLRHRFGKSAVIVDNATYHDSRSVRRYLKRNSSFVKLLFLSPYSPFLNLAEWLWRKSKARIRRTFRRPAESYFMRKVMLMYESFEISFNSCNILFRNLDKIFPT